MLLRPSESRPAGQSAEESARRPSPRPQRGGDLSSVRVVYLTNYVPLYQLRVYQSIRSLLGDFQILLSTPIEPNRDFTPDWSGLDVQIQSSVTLRRRWRHRRAGFDDPLFVHFPYDTQHRLKSFRPDVVVSHELGARSLAAAIYCRRHGAKLILATFMSEHTEIGRGWLRPHLRRWLIQQADAVTFNGPSCERYLRSLGARSEQLFPFTYAADDRHFRSETTRRQIAGEVTLPPVERLLCVGQLSTRKGVLPLLHQLNQYCRSRQRRVHLTLIGDGPLRRDLERLARGETTDDFASPLDSRLTLSVLGNQSAAELSRAMLAHGALIAPTLADEWLLVVNEALHSGLPVLGSIYSQAVTTLISDGVTGWQYDPMAGDKDGEQRRSGHTDSGDGVDLADVLDRYFSLSPTERQQMRQSALDVSAPITPERSAAALSVAVASVLGIESKPCAALRCGHTEPTPAVKATLLGSDPR